MTVAFFGHRKTPPEAKLLLRKELISLIEKHNADKFYIGNQGDFDLMVKNTLMELKESYPHISYTIVLAYIPNGSEKINEYYDTIYPEGLEQIPKKFAISKRNYWLIENSDMIVTYVRNPTGGAAKFKELAQKKGKQVINLFNKD